MDELLKGVQKFQQRTYSDNKALFDELVTGQNPEALLFARALFEF